MNNFRYPVLSEEDLIEFFNSNFLMSVNLVDFINPTRELVINILDKFLADFGDDYRIPKLKNTAHITNMSMHQTSIPLYNMYNEIRETIINTGFDFRLADLIRPQRRRNQILFSQIIGFWTQFFEGLEEWQGFSADRDVRARKNAELKKDGEVTKKLLEKKLLANSDLKNKLPDLEKLLATKEQKLSELKSIADRLKTTHKTNKEKKAQWRLQKMEILESLAQEKEKIEDLKNQIVRSPEKVFAKTKILEAQREEARDEFRILQQQLLEKQSHFEALSENLKFIESNNVAESFNKDVNKLCSISNELDAAQNEDAAHQQEIDRLDIKIASTKELLERTNKEKTAYAKNHERQMKVLKEMNDELKQKLTQLRMAKSEVKNSTDAKILLIRREVAEKREKRYKLKEQYETAKQRTEQQFIDYIDEINGPFRKIIEQVKRNKTSMFG